MEEPPRAWGRGLVKQCLVRLGQSWAGQEQQGHSQGMQSTLGGSLVRLGCMAGRCALMGKGKPVLLCTPEASPALELLPRAC